MLRIDEQVYSIGRSIDPPHIEFAPRVPDISIDGRYYEGGVSSVYFWDLDDGFAGVVLLKKSTRGIDRLPPPSNHGKR